MNRLFTTSVILLGLAAIPASSQAGIFSSLWRHFTSCAGRVADIPKPSPITLQQDADGRTVLNLRLNELAALNLEEYLPRTFRTDINPSRGVIFSLSGIFLEITEQSADGKYIEVSDIVGQVLYFEVVGRRWKRLTESEYRVHVPRKSIPAIPRDFVLKRSAIKDVAQQITQSVLGSSTSYKDRESVRERERERDRRALAREVENLLHKVAAGLPFNEHDLDRVNECFTYDEGRQFAAGIRRGSRRVKGNQVIDFSQFDHVVMQVAGEVFALPMENSRVPGALDEIFERMNRISSRTAIREIVQIDRDIVALHPYFDATGRTSLVFLNLNLIRAGFAPLPFNAGQVRRPFFTSLDTAERNLSLLYQ